MNRSGWWLCVLLMLLVLWPNLVLVHADGMSAQSLFTAPLDFLLAFRDAVSESTPLPAVVVFELFLLALLGRPWLWMLLHLPFLLWLPVELFYWHTYDAPTSPHILAILGETNFDEIRGYLGRRIWLALGAGLLWIGMLGALLLFFFRRVPPWRHRTRLWTLAVLGLCLATVLVVYKRHSDEATAKASNPAPACAIVGCPQSPFLYVFNDSYPLGLILRLRDYFTQQRLLQVYATQLRDQRLGLVRDPTLAAQPETYLMVIGESSRADHWQLFGYPRETNPLLSKREGLLAFDNVVSVTPATRTAVPILLSGASVEDISAFRLRPSWINAFKEAGFHVSWISTQMPVGTHDTTVGVYASLADHVEYLNAGTYRSLGSHDEILLPALDRMLAEPYPKRLIILHLLGSHAPYQRRYPPERAHFQPAPSPDAHEGIFDRSKAQEIGNAYDNSLRYTDFVLDSVIERLQAQQGLAALWYISDHGQTLPADGCRNTGNGFFSRANFQVPLLFWASSRYVQSFGGRLDAARANLHRPLYSADFQDSLLDSLGFELPPSRRERSFMNPQYQSGPRTVTIDGKEILDYDLAFAERLCKE